jgi:L-alanine-DL-glutamate epimerase-like enolase superfamily enzyme
VPVLTEHRLRIGERRFTLLEGPAGWGECSPMPGYPCDPSAARRAAEEAATVGFPPAVRDEIAVNALVQGRGFDPTALAGFGCVKVKVGYDGDVDVVAAVRDAVGPAVALRVDANGAWDVDQAVASLRVLAPAGIELAEEPVHGVEALRAVRAEVDVALAMDETAAEEGAPESGATDAVCLKIARCGGITGVLRDAASARVAGSVAYLASSYDGPLGIAAAVHAAAGLTAGGPLPAHGLATLAAFEDAGDRLHAVRGAIRVPREPGLGVA